MKHSLRSGGGFFEVDERESPGLTWADIPEKARLAGMFPVGKGQRFQSDAYNCTHCQRLIVLTAVTRGLSERGYCPKCDHYVCNQCERLRVATGFCWSVFRLMDRAWEVAQRFVGDPEHPDAKVDVLALKEPPPVRISLTDAWRTL